MSCSAIQARRFSTSLNGGMIGRVISAPAKEKHR